MTTLDKPPVLLRNETPSPGNRLQIALVGTRSNRDGNGARVAVTFGGKTVIREFKGGGSYLSTSDPRIHVGLGSADKAERVEIRWPSGAVDVLENVPANRAITVREGAGIEKP